MSADYPCGATEHVWPGSEGKDVANELCSCGRLRLFRNSSGQVRITDSQLARHAYDPLLKAAETLVRKGDAAINLFDGLAACDDFVDAVGEARRAVLDLGGAI